MTRPPTPAQLATLKSVETQPPGFREDYSRNDPSQPLAWGSLRSLLSSDWIAPVPQDGYTLFVLTERGKGVLAVADAHKLIAQFSRRTVEGLRVRVNQRVLGPNSSTERHDHGWEVVCFTCQEEKEKRGQGRASATVWFVNMSGDEARADAENAYAFHVAAHLRGPVVPDENH